MQRLLALLILLSLSSGWTPTSVVASDLSPAVADSVAHVPELAEAVEIYSEYIRRLRSGNKSGARALWHPDDDMPLYDWSLGYVTWKVEDFKTLGDSITAVRRARKGESACVELEVTWSAPDRRPSVGTWTLVPHRGSWILTSAIRLWTAGWLEKRVGRLVVHAAPGHEIDWLAIADVDAGLTRALEQLQTTLPGPIHLYACESEVMVGHLFDRAPIPALAHLRNSLVATVHEFSLHEILHVVLYWVPESRQGRPLGVVAEAAAYGLGGTTIMSPRALLSWGAQLFQLGRGANLPHLVQRARAHDQGDDAAQLAAIMRFLFDLRGAPGFKDLYANSKGWPTVGEAVKHAYGQDWSQLEPHCRHTTVERYGPTAKAGILGRDAQVVFEIQDATGDDTGDGDYVYPTVDFLKPGALDLVGLRVTRTSGRVGFEIELANVSPGASSWGFFGSFTRIGVQRGTGRYRTLDLGDDTRAGCQAENGVDLLIDVSPDGVLVRTARGQWIEVLKVPSAGEPLVVGSKIAFSLPQSLIGVPDRTWRYQVVTGYHVPATDITRGVGRLSTVAIQANDEGGGGGDPDGWSPNLYDVLLPAGIDQEKILGSYSAQKKRLAKLPLVP